MHHRPSQSREEAFVQSLETNWHAKRQAAVSFLPFLSLCVCVIFAWHKFWITRGGENREGYLAKGPARYSIRPAHLFQGGEANAQLLGHSLLRHGEILGEALKRVDFLRCRPHIFMLHHWHTPTALFPVLCRTKLLPG